MACCSIPSSELVLQILRNLRAIITTNDIYQVPNLPCRTQHLRERYRNAKRRNELIAQLCSYETVKTVLRYGSSYIDSVRRYT
jgi:hypothetical protein